VKEKNMSRIIILYHYYYPDDVVSAVQFTGLAEGLAKENFLDETPGLGRTWEIEAWPSNRSCHHREAAYSLKPEKVNGVLIRRVFRPAFNQHSFVGRVVNALWVEAAWVWRALFSKTPPDMVIFGSDPIFTVFLAPFFRWRWPGAKIIHWCFDLYPEYAVAEGLVPENSLLVRFLKALLRPAYAACDLVADLGSCMRERLRHYPGKKNVTLTPWALEEPQTPMAYDPDERGLLFGDSPLGLLYSGNMSHPHRYDQILALARFMGKKAVFAFSARGSRLEELKKTVTVRDENIRFVPFASPDKLGARLSAPDVHLVSLKSSYTGVAVPSKFFGALAAGRPVLFEGNEDSAIARWIREYGVGWVLESGNIAEIAEEMARFAADPDRKAALFQKCHQVYHLILSKKTVVDDWRAELSELQGSPSDSMQPKRKRERVAALSA
jgi:glycosyltransferase involved in cell wall biosynthesis